MSLFPRLTVSALWKPQTISDLDAELDAAFGGQPTLSGVSIGENSALNYLALYSCVLVRAKAIGGLSLHLYRRQEDGAERATDHRLYGLVHDAPNEETTSTSWRSALSGHIDTWGNSYTWLDRPTVGRNAGHVQRMFPLKPDRVSPFRDAAGRLKYEYKRKRADGTEEDLVYDRDQILHIPGMGYDGVMGYSPVSLARQAIGLGFAAEEFESRFFGQGTHLSGTITVEAGLNPEQAKDYHEALRRTYAGLGRSHNLMLLTHGGKYQAMTMPLQDAQFLGLRQFQLAEMARLYRVPLILLQDQEKTTSWGTGVEQILIGFVRFTLAPELREWEQRMNLTLLTEKERQAGYRFEHDLNSLMRGDAKSRAEFYKIMRELGAFSPNDILKLENRNPRKGGDEYWDQGPSGQGGQSKQEPESAASLRPVFRDISARICKRENQDLTRMAERFAKSDDMDGFSVWLGGWWDKHEQYCRSALAPAFEALGTPERAKTAAKRHVNAVQTDLRLMQADGIDGIKAWIEGREPPDLASEEECA